MNAKKQKIDHHESFTGQRDHYDCLNPAKPTTTGEVIARPPPRPREIRDFRGCSVVAEVTLNQPQQTPTSPCYTMEAESKDAEQEEFKLPPLRLPEVFDFSNLSFGDRFDDLAEILANRKPCEAEQAFTDHVDAAVERAIGMDGSHTMACVWRSSDLACDVLVQMREVFWNSFPVMVRVELMEPFCYQVCPTGRSITQDLTQSLLKNHNNKVNIMEIFPVYDDSGALDEVALAIEQMRFFFNYIWRLSDSNDMGEYSFARRHLEPRLKLYYDVLKRKVSTGFCQKYQDTMAEYQAKCRQLRYQQARLDSDEDSFQGSDTSMDKLHSDFDHGMEDSNEKDFQNALIKDNNREVVKDSDTNIEAHDRTRCTDRVKHSCIEKDVNHNTDSDQDREGCKDGSKGKLDELGVLEIAHLWKDIEILEDSLEVMENPVMRYLMAIPPSSRRRRPSTALQLKQTRHHIKPVTHLVANTLTVGMLQSLQLPADTVLETHTTPTSALKSCYDKDTILIFPGTYTGEGFGVIQESVTIQGIGDGQDVVIMDRCGEREVTSLVTCQADSITITNLTFVDESDCVHSNGLLYVGQGTTSLTNCRFSCRSAGIIAGLGHLKMVSCEVFGAQSAGVIALQEAKLSLKSSSIHHCGRTTPSALPQDMCGILIDLQQIPECNTTSSTSAKVITDCRIHDNAGCGILVRLFGSSMQQEEDSLGLDDLCTLAGSDLQITDSDFIANAKGMAMVQCNCEGKLDLN